MPDRPGWKAVYFRHGRQYEEEHDDFSSAVGCLFWGAENGDLSPSRIVSPSGEVTEDLELTQAFTEYEERAQRLRGADNA